GACTQTATGWGPTRAASAWTSAGAWRAASVRRWHSPSVAGTNGGGGSGMAADAEKHPGGRVGEGQAPPRQRIPPRRAEALGGAAGERRPRRRAVEHGEGHRDHARGPPLRARL